MTVAGDREISKGIVVNPGRCGGRPLIKGTRTYAAIIARELKRETWDWQELADNYGLTLNDVVNVRYWARRRGAIK